MEIRLREAEQGDREFMWDVQSVTLGSYVTEAFGTTQAEQRAYFDEHHRLEGTQIVTVDGYDAGVFAWRPRDDHWFLANIGLLPQFQGSGIGTALITELLGAADAASVDVHLQVLQSNPRALALYRRLGFVVVGRTATHTLMVRAPRPA